MTDHESDIGKEQEQVRVKVTDRRKFDKDGQLRDGTVEDAPEPAAGPAEAPTASTHPAAAQSAASASAKPAGKGDTAAGGGKQQGRAGGVDFQSFVYFLYMSALHELGVPTQPGEAARPADLERARFFVDVLQLLEGKTAGNLEPGEAKLLEEALYNLRMQYVGVSQGRAD